VSTPVPFRPKHLRQFSEAELEALERLNLNGSDSPISPLRTANSQAHTDSKKVNLELLEEKAEAVNGHAESS
jgi:hypothetical protein